MRTGILALILLAAPFVAANPAAAQSTDAILYPVISFFDWTGGPLRDIQDQQLGRYQFEEGMLGAVSRAAQRYPEHLSSIDDEESARRELQGVADAALHNRPDVPYDHWGDVGNPDYMPDWNHDGVFGGVGDFDADTDGDLHGDSSAHLDTAFFLYPCIDEATDRVHYRYVDGTCDTNDEGAQAYALGVARELKLVNARGLVLDATLWVPGKAFASPPSVSCSDPAHGVCDPQAAPALDGLAAGMQLPGVVFNNGLSSRQEHYYWFAMRMAAEGFIALTYDPAGQGESEGGWVDLIDFFNQSPDALDLSGSGETTGCQFRGACRDAEDVVRWFVGDSVTDVRADLNDRQLRIAERRNPCYADDFDCSGDNVRNPARSVLDATRVAIAGNSMGALSTLHYLFDLGNPGHEGMDGNPLPPVVAAISLSGAQPTHAVVPVQFQTSDYDGSPTLVGPTVFGVALGQGASGIGYHLIKQLYDNLRDDPERSQPIEMVVLEGGVHTDHAGTPDITKTTWAIRLASSYAADWLNCHVQGDPDACAAAVTPQSHLSRALATEQAPGDDRGAESSQCITVPDRAILNQPPLDFVNALSGKHVCDCQGAVDGRSCDTDLSEVPY